MQQPWGRSVLTNSLSGNPDLKNAPVPLLQNAINAAIVLDQQLNVLLDGYDFYVARYGGVPGEEQPIEDATVSIKELGKLPLDIAIQMASWRKDQEPQLSRLGFELYVINEFTLHMFAIYSLLERKGIELEKLDLEKVSEAFAALRDCNRALPLNNPEIN